MSDKSTIEWTQSTWNPLRGTAGRWSCARISEGCTHCYAATLNRRFGGPDYGQAPTLNDPVRLDERALLAPLAWRKPRRIFVCSMTDVAGEWIPEDWLDRIFAVMAYARQHTYQVLTKRPTRLREYLTAPLRRVRIEVALGELCEQRKTPCNDELEGWPLPNVWLGTSVELDRFAWRAKVLAETPAAVRFVSAEPLLGPLPSLQLSQPCGVCKNSRTTRGCMACDERGTQRTIDWLITGGESGAHHRPLDLEWVRELRDRCQAAGVAFFHKQHGGRTPKSGGRLLDGKEWSEYPTL